MSPARRGAVPLLVCATLLLVEPARSDESHVLTGTYRLPEEGSEPEPVRATFTHREPEGWEGDDETWWVTFDFSFGNGDYSFSGKALGGLVEGRLGGTVKGNDRTFVFRGEHGGGEYRATHAETTSGVDEETGVMTLTAPAEPSEPAEETEPAAAGAAGVSIARSEQTLSGTYTSSYQDRPSRIRALLTPRDGDGEIEAWDVVFDFRYGKNEYTYRGIAEGGATEGELWGRVRNESGNRLFIFRGEHRKGKYHATHAEIIDDREHKTGAMVLRP